MIGLGYEGLGCLPAMPLFHLQAQPLQVREIPSHEVRLGRILSAKGLEESLEKCDEGEFVVVECYETCCDQRDCNTTRLLKLYHIISKSFPGKTRTDLGQQGSLGLQAK